MNFLIGFFAALLTLNCALALPANPPNDDAEVISVPRRCVEDCDEDDDTDYRNFKGVIDTGSGYPFLQPHPHPFLFNFGLFDTFDDIFRQFRERLWPVAIDDDSDSTEIGSRGSFDTNKGNSTSTVKVINGHKIEVNETVYGDDDNSFRVRIVNIRPVNSGEDVEEPARTNVAFAKPASNDPVTSSPNKEREDIDDSDETREPLERDNEVRDLNEEKTVESNNAGSTFLASATTTIGKTLRENKRNAILSAAFITDNSYEDEESRNGNIEAETNKPTESKMLENYDGTTVTTEALTETEAEAAATTTESFEAALDEGATTIAPNDAVAEASEDVIYSVSGVHDASLTIENNEKTETNDNFNESSEDAGNAATAVEITKDFNKLTLNGNTENEQEEHTSSSLELNGEVAATAIAPAQIPPTSAIETFDVDENFPNDESHPHVYGDAENVEIAYLSHGSLIKEREDDDASSSDDNENAAEPIEMNPVFNAEWENLAESLQNTNDQFNDLNNEIDVYESVPIDLSNDIAVNDIAAAQPDFPINPDAEFVDIDGVIKSNDSMPKFEKLSLSAGFQPETAELTSAK